MDLPTRPYYTEAPARLAIPAHFHPSSSDAKTEAGLNPEMADGDADKDASNGHSDEFPADHEHSDNETEVGVHGYLDAIFTFENGSRWQLTRALSPLKYQQGTPPFEARQVFDCICVEDPQGLYKDRPEAVIKVKYQVHGTSRSAFYFFDYKFNWDKRVRLLSKKPHTDEPKCQAYEEAVCDAKYAEYLYQLAMHPAPSHSLHLDTRREAVALKQLGDSQCTHAPHLLEVSTDCPIDEIDEEALPGGYAVFMLMTKVKGKALGWETFWDMDESTRANVRRAFKEAMKELWDYGIRPQDRNLNNLIWDAEERKFYIVDFEVYDVVQENEQMETMWTDDYYSWWRIAEECKPDARRMSS